MCILVHSVYEVIRSPMNASKNSVLGEMLTKTQSLSPDWLTSLFLLELQREALEKQ